MPTARAGDRQDHHPRKRSQKPLKCISPLGANQHVQMGSDIREIVDPDAASPSASPQRRLHR
jgi:hypothetical protein